MNWNESFLKSAGKVTQAAKKAKEIEREKCKLVGSLQAEQAQLDFDTDRSLDHNVGKLLKILCKQKIPKKHALYATYFRLGEGKILCYSAPETHNVESDYDEKIVVSAIPLQDFLDMLDIIDCIMSTGSTNET